MSGLRVLKEVVLTNKSVILRCDFNISVLENGDIIDDSRILSSLETIKYLLSVGAKIIIISHFGRPELRDFFTDKFSLRNICNRLSELLDFNVNFISGNLFEEETLRQVTSFNYGKILMLENLRFYKEEELNDLIFSKRLSEFGNVYVNDAFSCSHRNHASIIGIAKFLPSFSGFNLEREILTIKNIFSQKNINLLSIIGGSKISTKINIVKSLLKKTKYLFLCGGMANTFLASLGFNIGNSIFEKDFISLVNDIMKMAKDYNCEIIFPSDVMVSNSAKRSILSRICDLKDIQNEDVIVDIGPNSIFKILEKIKNSSHVMWNGPIGIYEIDEFSIGSSFLSRIIAKETSEGKIISVAGGGDAVSCIKKTGLQSQFSYISTGGGAFLEYIENFSLPGIDILFGKIDL